MERLLTSIALVVAAAVGLLLPGGYYLSMASRMRR
jgi:hypothetical protein